MAERVLFRGGIFTGAQLELLKVIGFAAMVWDHVNGILLSSPVTAIGRLALPLFAVALADGVSRSLHPESTLKRLVLWGLVSQPVYMLALGVSHGNVLLTFACGVGVSLSVRRWRWMGVLPAVGCLYLAFLCEGSVFAAFVVVAAFQFSRDRSVGTAGYLVLAIVSLEVVNGSAWALLSLPVCYLVSRTEVYVPRVSRLFYVAYPVHLVLLLAVQPLRALG